MSSHSTIPDSLTDAFKGNNWGEPPEYGSGLSAVWAKAATVLLLSLLFFLPEFRVSSQVLPSVLIAAVLLGPVAFYTRMDKIVLCVLSCAFAYLVLASANMLLLGSGGLKDALYPFILAEYALMYAVVSWCFARESCHLFALFASLLVTLEVVVMFLQLFDIMGINELFSGYWQYICELGHRMDPGDAAAAILFQSRPFGTLGNPTIAAAVLYLTARSIFVLKGKRLFLYLSLFAAILSAARTTIVLFIIYEFVVSAISRNAGKTILRISGYFFVLLIIAVGVWLLYDKLETDSFLAFYVNTYFDSPAGLTPFDDHSFVYRSSMYEQFLSLTKYYWFGGVAISQLPKAIDSELIMRTLQFGILGYLAFLCLPILALFRFKNRDALFLLFFCAISSSTITLASNPYVVPFIVIYYCALEYKYGISHERATYRG